MILRDQVKQDASAVDLRHDGSRRSIDRRGGRPSRADLGAGALIGVSLGFSPPRLRLRLEHATRGANKRRRYVPTWKALAQLLLTFRGRGAAIGEGVGGRRDADDSEDSDRVIDSVAAMIFEVEESSSSTLSVSTVSLPGSPSVGGMTFGGSSPPGRGRS